jgi:splicing factor 3B subunit 3
LQNDTERATFVVVAVQTREGNSLVTLHAARDGALAMVHSTTVTDSFPASALHITAGGWLLAGVGPAVNIYSYGKSQLLRKDSLPVVPNRVVALCSVGAAVCAADVQASVFILRLVEGGLAPALHVVADDYVPRFATCCMFVDTHTVAVGDRFGDVTLLRFSADAFAAAAPPATEDARSWVAPESHAGRMLKGANYKLTTVAQFHVGDVVVALDATAPAATAAAVDAASSSGAGMGADGALEAVMASKTLYYATSLGAIGAFVCLSSDDFAHLRAVEAALDANTSPLIGRGAGAYRSWSAPAVGVVDLEFIEHALRVSANRDAALELVSSKSEAARNRALMMRLPVLTPRPLEEAFTAAHEKAEGIVE